MKTAAPKITTTRLKAGMTGWLFISIAVIMIAAFYFYPMIQALILSFKTGTGSNLSFNGIDNYKRLFSDKMFITAVKNTFIYLIFQVPLMVILALFISVLLNDKNLKFKGFFRTAIFLPCITSLVAYSVVFKYLFSSDGLVNSLLLNLHVIGTPIQWITDPFWVKVTIIIAITWRWTGYNMIFYLSGLQNIDSSIYEVPVLTELPRSDSSSALRFHCLSRLSCSLRLHQRLVHSNSSMKL